MLANKSEYDKMAAAEGRHWWYVTLHNLIYSTIKNRFTSRDIAILDAGCGTGGLMLYLTERGYALVNGFDVSDYALSHCRTRGLHVLPGSLTDAASVYAGQQFDVITCCDALYFIDAPQQKAVLAQLYSRLRPGGLLMLNLPALECFSGIHDISVGIGKRYHHRLLPALLPSASYSYRYWPVCLSPFIAMARYLQRQRMATGGFQINSDVAQPTPVINNVLRVALKVETMLPPVVPIGSSLFVVVSKEN
jgi:SAM-dependent methyltransferase